MCDGAPRLMPCTMLLALVSPVEETAAPPPIAEAAMRLKCCMLTPPLMPMLEAMELEGPSGLMAALVGCALLP